MSANDYAIRVRGVGKQYRLGAERADLGMYRYKSLRDTLGGIAKHPLGAMRRSLDRKSPRRREGFWALKDVSFDVRQGEVVGVIGRNGAGKSTLLKILSRITRPSTGEIELRGRVGSLLEVGTGFHPELSGRENIYLNGAILGMTRAEVKAKFDEIVAFSDVERFLDTPVKQFSSGMYMKLAFAVAAHLDPEILVVDEVLAVGDAAFQRKCIGKMRDVARHHKTVIFVSHNMPAVNTLCDSALILSNGQVVFSGDATSAANHYLASGEALAEEQALVRPSRPPGGIAWVESIELLCDGSRGATLRSGGALTIRIVYAAHSEIQPVAGLIISSIDGTRIVHASLRNMGGLPESVPGRRAGQLDLTLPELRLTPGDYEITLHFGDRGADHHSLHSCARFKVVASDPFRSGLAYSERHSHLWWPLAVTANGVSCSFSLDPSS